MPEGHCKKCKQKLPGNDNEDRNGSKSQNINNSDVKSLVQQSIRRM